MFYLTILHTIILAAHLTDVSALEFMVEVEGPKVLDNNTLQCILYIYMKRWVNYYANLSAFIAVSDVPLQSCCLLSFQIRLAHVWLLHLFPNVLWVLSDRHIVLSEV